MPALLAALAITLTAASQDARPAATQDLLAGPKVKDSESAARINRPTLVVRGFDGEIARVGPEPGEEALRAMQQAGGQWALDDTEQRALEAVATARAAALDALLRANYQELLKLQGLGARASGADVATRLAAVLELGQALSGFTPYFDHGSFLDDFARTESARPATVEAARYLESRYITTLVRSAQKREADRQGKVPSELAIRVRLRLEHFGALLKRAIERKVEFGRAEFDAFAERLGIDGATREKIKTELMPVFLAELAGKATPSMRMQALSKVYAMLDPDQRRQLLAFIAERRAR